ncbi:MAG: tetratricopeptide repeat protein [Cyanobacteriota bacterium]|nr:tetratricopeptide repeat protein [Cyanobacteriota bacterium]
MNLPLARYRLYQEVQQPDSHISLASAALYIAQEEYPHLDVEEYIAALDAMAEEVLEQLPPQRYPLKVIQTINQYLFRDLGFRGNTTDYYDPRNSFLNEVIERRTGIPITLSLVYLEIARRVDFPMVPIGLPGHFLIRPEFAEVGIYVDAFHEGNLLFTEDCQERLAQVYGEHAKLQPEFLQPVSHRFFLVRMLTNLKHIYLAEADLQRGLACVERILVLVPEALLEWRDRGLLYYQLGRWAEARQDLEQFLQGIPQSSEAWLSEARVIRKLLETLNQGLPEARDPS